MGSQNQQPKCPLEILLDRARSQRPVFGPPTSRTSYLLSSLWSNKNLKGHAYAEAGKESSRS